MKAADKTNMPRTLERRGVPCSGSSYELEGAVGRLEAAGLRRGDAKRVFKALVAPGGSGACYVFVIPADADLDLKRAAEAAGRKSLEMLRQEGSRFPSPAIVHGGCPPIGMRKMEPAGAAAGLAHA